MNVVFDLYCKEWSLRVVLSLGEVVFSNELKINGAACLTFAMDEKHIYDNATNKFVSGELVDNAVTLEEISELQELVKVTRNKKELLLKEYEERNKTLITIGSLKACTKSISKLL